MALSRFRWNRARRRRDIDVLFLSELYWPEETSTGHIITGLAEGIAIDRNVAVIAAQPTYSQRGIRAAAREVRNNVEVFRVRSTLLAKDSMTGRLVNHLSVSLSILGRTIRVGRRARIVVSVTNPPMLPYLGVVAAHLVRAQHVVMVHDGYPDLLVAAGLLEKEGMLAKTLERLVTAMYARSSLIIVVGTDMEARTNELTRPDREGTTARVVRNWADLESVTPLPRQESDVLASLGISADFVVQFAGNLGRLQDVPTVLAAMESLKARTDIHLLIVGTGSERLTAERWIADGRLPNVTVIDPVPRESAARIHRACDVALVTLIPGMLGVSVPSRSYNFMAAGRPIIAMVHPDSEIGRVVDEDGVGWLCEPGSERALAASIEFAADHPDEVLRKGLHARRIAEQKYTRDASVAALVAALDSISDGSV